MDTDDLSDKPKNIFCIKWSDLIDSKNRGEVYDFFDKEREEMIEHLGLCGLCKNFIVQIEPMPTVINYLDILTPREFATLIREVYTNAKAQGLSVDDDEDTWDPLF